MIVYGVVNNKDREKTTPLGNGAIMTSLTVALNVPDVDDKYSILKSMRRLTLQADTSSRKGVQNLLSDVALELLRQDVSTESAFSSYDYFQNSDLAQRAFQAESIRSRSKFDQETVNKFGGQDRTIVPTDLDTTEAPSKAAKAVVTINLAIEGSSTKLPKISTRDDLKECLTKIAQDCVVEDCLLSGEVLWSPDGPNETLSRDELVEKYPNLVSL